MIKNISKNKFNLYFITSIFSLIFAVVGFSYNAWRLEVSEENNTKRTAAFEVLSNLAELEQVIFSAHYDKDENAGNPRKGWVKVGLIVDLSILIDTNVAEEAELLKVRWTDNWLTINESTSDIGVLTKQIDQVRNVLKKELSDLK